MISFLPAKSLLVYALAIVSLFVIFDASEVRAQHCDESVLTPRGRDNKYEERGTQTPRRDRCEGIYNNLVGSPYLEIVSFIEAFDEFNPFTDSLLYIHWPPYRDSVHIRSVGVRRNLFYRMDTVRSPEEKTFEWPTFILFNERIWREDIAVVAWVEQQINGKQESVYVPLNISTDSVNTFTDNTPSSSKQYELVVLPGVALDEVKTSLAPVEEGRGPGAFIYNDRPLNQASYPAGKPIRIEVPHESLMTYGIYFLEIAIDATEIGAEERIGVYFYHPAPLVP